MARVVIPELVGRENELAELDEALSAAAAGNAASALIVGEAGVGKTRLIRELERRARARGMVVLRGECLELEGGDLPYAPIVGALQRAPAEALDAALDAMPAAGRAEIGRLVPELGPQAPAREDDPSPYAKGRLFELLLWLLRSLAGDGAVLLCIEDLHWADAATRDLIGYLVRNGETAHLALVMTYRSDELRRAEESAVRKFVGELRRSDDVRSMTLDRLGRDSVVRLLDASLGRPADDRLIDEVFERSQGNPFFVEELLAARRDGTDARLPDSLLDALLVRVEALPPDALDVVRALGVLGRPARQDLLAAVLDVPEADLSKPLRAAIGLHVLTRRREDDAFEFCHALVREAVDQDLMPGERKSLHAAAAAALEASGDASAAELAGHWLLAGVPAVAFAAQVAAGAEAERVYAFEEARRHFESALALRSEEGDEVELINRAATAARFTGDWSAAAELGRRALALVDADGDPHRAALQHERMGEYLFWNDEARIESCETALALLPADADTDRARILGAKALALHYLFRWGEASACAQEALDVALAAGAGAEEASARMTLGTARAFLGDPESGEAECREAMRIADAGGNPEQRLRTRAHVAEVLRIRGRTGEALELMEEGVQLASELGMRGSFGHVMWMNAAEDLFQLGRWDEAVERLRTGDRIELREASELLQHSVLGQLAAARGSFEEAHARLDRALELCTEETSCDYLAGVHAGRAEVAIWEHRLDDAAHEVAVGLEAIGELEDPLYTPILYSLGARVEAERAVRARAMREPAAAEHAQDAAKELATRIGRLIDRHAARIPPPEAVAHRAACDAELARILGRHDAGWDRVALAWEELVRPYPAAYALWRQAEALLDASGRSAAAAEFLRRAETTALALGAEPLLGEIRALARRSRTALDGAVEPEPAADAAPFGLTQRELEVLGLLAEGCSNRDIARRLFISENTAGVHVSHILSKLDAGKRGEAAAIAHRLGLVDTTQAPG